jgi:hypothetical protein
MKAVYMVIVKGPSLENTNGSLSYKLHAMSL